MELDTLLEKLQSRLLLNDERLDEIDTKRKELTRICKEEEAKIAAVCAEVQTRVNAASEALKNKSAVEFKRQDEEFSTTRDEVVKDSRALSAELDKIMEVNKKGDGNNFDIMTCWENVKQALSASHDSTTRCLPTFHSSKTLVKVKASDLGYICTAEFLPNQYQLSLTYPATETMEAGSNQKAICTVLTNQMFTDMIQSNIKFSIKNKACKESVPYCKEECKLSEDKKSFQIAFLVQRPGNYVVTVLLYDQHVVDSPLAITVAESKSLNKVKQSQEERAIQVEKSPIPEKFGKSEVVAVSISPSPTANPINPVTAVASSSTPATSAASAPRPSMRRPFSATLPKSDPPARSIPSPAPLSSAPPPHSSTLGTRSLKGVAASSGSGTVMSLLPPGPLNLSSLTPGSRLAGLRMLSIEEGVKEESLHKPIGMCILLNGNIAVASTFEGKVKIFDPEGKFVTQVISPEPQFDRPSDMVALQSGQFVVRDNTRVQVFSAKGNFMKNMWQDKGQDKCYGLAQDKDGRLITIMESRRPRKTDLLFFDLSTGELVKKIEMEDIIANKGMSKCRFLTYELGKLYITDLGLDCVYILDPVTINAKVFGSSGSDPGQFCDPAGLVVDIVGNMIVADSKNHRLCVFSAEGKFVCHVSLSPETRRPSGVALDKERKELFVLNLQGKAAMTKYKLK